MSLIVSAISESAVIYSTRILIYCVNINNACTYDISTSGSTAFRNAAFGEGTGAVFLEGLECDGTESSLLECPMDTQLGLSQCDHSEDSGIRCYGKYVHTYIF